MKKKTAWNRNTRKQKRLRIHGVAGEYIHVIIIRWGLNHMIVNGNVRLISVHVRGTNLTWENRMVHGEYF